MSGYELPKDEVQSWTLMGMDVWAPFRVAGRFTGLVAWCIAGLVATACVIPLAVVFPAAGRRIRKWVARTWVKGVPVLLGMRIRVSGRVPDAPFFLVGNHISWLDFFVTHTLIEATCVTESVIEKIPVMGRILKGLDLIIIRRTRRELLEMNRQIAEAIASGKNLVMAPEATVSPGRRVCHFHSALFEPAVRAGMPVHYASLTVRTPDGSPPASQSLIIPDPDFPSKDFAECPCDLERWGKSRGAFGYVWGLLSLPWHEFTVTFAPEPIRGTDRMQLAKDLEKAVQAIFTPVK